MSIGEGNHFAKTAYLTPRNIEILQHIAVGITFSEIARRYCVGNPAIHRHTRQIKDRLGATTLPNAIYIALERGLIK